MLDLIFKRSTGKHSFVRKPPQRHVAANHTAPQDPARQAAVVEAQALDNEESAVEFILRCQFADARLHAAQHVHSRAMLERVLTHSRNSDRRVAKLMHGRLDALKQHETSEHKAQHCVQEALRLGQEQKLLPNQVAELDHAWQAVDVPPEPWSRSFEEARARLRARLEAQADLQRAAIDALERLRTLADTAAQTAPASLGEAMDALALEVACFKAAPEAPSLPRHLLSDLEQGYGSFKEKLAAMAQQMPQQPDAPEPETSKPEKKAAPDDIRELKKQADQQRKQQASAQLKQEFTEALASMDKALQEGALQAAAEYDRKLRAMDMKVLRPNDAQAAQLAKVRAELTRLQGWAKWGGNVSREELLKAAQELPGKSLAPSELAKKVGSLRERWKSLDTSAGPAPKELWKCFDAACSTAYAPAAAHFKKLTEERQANLAKAQSLIDEARQFSAACGTADAAAADWKAVAHFCTRMEQVWHRLGAIDRKEKKRLDAEFAASMQALSVPLTQQRADEIKRREKLIAEVSALKPEHRSALDALHTLQERWQTQAKALPLERKQEQALWQRFRAACDAVFAKRKEAASAADADRRQHLQAKEAVCATLESAAALADTAVSQALRDAREAWRNIGAVPRAAENRIEARYKAAVAALDNRLQTARQAAAAAQGNALRDKFRLCLAVEAAIVRQQAPDMNELECWRTGWQALPVLQQAFEKAMRTRFDAALDAMQTDSRKYVPVLEQNRSTLSHELLRCEIMLGIESPPEFSRERLQLQVEVLQASLKSGKKTVTQEEQILRVCTLPVDAAGTLAQRIEGVIARLKKNAA